MKAQQKEIEEIQSQLSIKEDASGQIVNTFPEQLRTSLASLGLTITEKGNLELGEMKANIGEIQELENVNKLEMVDQATGEVYCTWIENGEWVKVKGRCSTLHPSIKESIK